MMYRSFVTLLSLGLVAVGTVKAKSIDIDVGEDGALSFKPDTSTANIGDTLEFHFYSGSGGHSVVSSTFDSPCVPAPNAFFSGYIKGSDSGDDTFIVNVTSTDPIWFYCSLATHCQGGMVGVVNPPPGKTADDFAAAAAKVAKGSAPAALQGGVLTSIENDDDDSSTSASVAGSSTSAAPATTTASGSGSVTTGTGGAASSTPTSSGAPVTSSKGSSSSSSSSSSASASSPSTVSTNNAGRNGENTVLGLGAILGGLVALMA